MRKFLSIGRKYSRAGGKRSRELEFCSQKRFQFCLVGALKMLSRISCFGKWTVNLHSAQRNRFLPTKVPDKAVYHSGCAKRFGSYRRLSEKTYFGYHFKVVRSNEIGPRFVKTGAEWASRLVWQAWRRRYLITRTRYIDGICLSASMVLLSRCSSVSNMV